MAIDDQRPLGHEFGPRPDGSEVVGDVDLDGSVASPGSPGQSHEAPS